MAFVIFILCVTCQGVHLAYFGWGALSFGCLNLYSVIVINSIYKKFKEEYNVYRSKVDHDQRLLLQDIDVDVESAIAFENEVNCWIES